MCKSECQGGDSGVESWLKREKISFKKLQVSLVGKKDNIMRRSCKQVKSHLSEKEIV